MEDKFDKTYTRFMDAAFELLDELSEIDESELTEKEIEFVEAFDEYLIELSELVEHEENLN